MKYLIIDGSNLRNGGGVTHIVELLNNIDENNILFDKIYIYSNRNTLSKIKDSSLIVKQSHWLLNKSLLFILVWKIFIFERKLKSFKGKCVLFDPPGTYSGKFKPFVAMSRNMLIFESKESNRFSSIVMRIRFKVLRIQQIKTFNKASGIIFISNYAKNIIIPYLNSPTLNYKLIHHGVNQRFRNEPSLQSKIDSFTWEKPFRFLYVSPITVYKHQVKLVEAFANLRKAGYPIVLDLVGDYYLPEYKTFQNVRLEYDSNNSFILYHGKIDYEKLTTFYHNTDGIIFASSCENMPNVLIESMSSGKPVICSNMGPMREFLGRDYPFYFNPTDLKSIVESLKKYLERDDLRYLASQEASVDAQKYNWKVCAQHTISYLEEFI